MPRGELPYLVLLGKTAGFGCQPRPGYHSTHGGGQHRPSIIFLQVVQRFDLHHQLIARLGRGWLRLRGSSPTGTAYAARGGGEALGQAL